jgi:hypothetical protein
MVLANLVLTRRWLAEQCLLLAAREPLGDWEPGPFERCSSGCSARQTADSRKLPNRPYPFTHGQPESQAGSCIQAFRGDGWLGRGCRLDLFPHPGPRPCFGVDLRQDSLAEARPLVGLGRDDWRPGGSRIADRLRRCEEDRTLRAVSSACCGRATARAVTGSLGASGARAARRANHLEP